MEKRTLILDENDLVTAYHTRVLPALVYIEHTCLVTKSVSAGTGTVIGYQGNKDEGWLPLIITAGHVIKNKGGHESHFKLTRYDFSNLEKPTKRTCEFETGDGGSRSPCGILYTGPRKDIIDIGFIRGVKDCTDGKPFFQGEPFEGTMSIEDDWYWSAEGDHVAWAGFPSLAATIAGRPQPCYFEGQVSAFIATDDFVTYLLDGHNTFGVSGGPVWAKRGENLPRIIGVISGYHSILHAPQMPGLVIAVPIQPVRVFLEQVWGAFGRSKVSQPGSRAM